MCESERRNLDCFGVGAYDLDNRGARDVFCVTRGLVHVSGSFWIRVYCCISLSNFLLRILLGFFNFVLRIHKGGRVLDGGVLFCVGRVGSGYKDGCVGVSCIHIGVIFRFILS